MLIGISLVVSEAASWYDTFPLTRHLPVKLGSALGGISKRMERACRVLASTNLRVSSVKGICCTDGGEMRKHGCLSANNPCSHVLLASARG